VVTPHVVRYTFSVTTTQKGISPSALQRLLGQDWLTATEIYLNLSPEEVVREFREKRSKPLRTARFCPHAYRATV
jgi:integrase/recombinase XerD